MRKTTPSLNALRAFEAAARHQSFARAAEELVVTPSAISQLVSSLETNLGIKLFSREKQRLQLTDAGINYQVSLKAALDRIESATVDLVSHGGNVRLRIGALPSLASYWLIPRLKRFAKHHPTISLQIVTLDLNFASAERTPNLEGGRIDIGIYYGDGHWPNLISEKLMEERLIAVVSPSIAKASQLTDDQLIETLPLLQHSTRPESWASWFQLQKQTSRSPRGPSFEHFHMLVEAAKAGLGVALVPEFFVQSEIERKSLVRVSEYALPAARAYYVVFDPAKSEDKSCQSFRSWLHAEAKTALPSEKTSKLPHK